MNETKKWNDALCQIIQDTFGYYDEEKTNFSTMKGDIMEDLKDLNYSPWYHIHTLMNSLLPISYQFTYTTKCDFLQHIQRVKRIGVNGFLHDEQAVYNVDAILSLR